MQLGDWGKADFMALGQDISLTMTLFSQLSPEDQAKYRPVIEQQRGRFVNKWDGKEEDGVVAIISARDEAQVIHEDIVGSFALADLDEIGKSGIVAELGIEVVDEWQGSRIATMMYDKVLSYLQAAGATAFDVNIYPDETSSDFHKALQRHLEQEGVFLTEGVDYFYYSDSASMWIMNMQIPLQTFKPPAWIEAGATIAVTFDANNKVEILPDSKNVGGIDLNPDNLDIRTHGSGMEVDIPVIDIKSFETPAFTGFTPVIIEIVPVTNFPMILGTNVKRESDQLSKVFPAD